MAHPACCQYVLGPSGRSHTRGFDDLGTCLLAGLKSHWFRFGDGGELTRKWSLVPWPFASRRLGRRYLAELRLVPTQGVGVTVREARPCDLPPVAPTANRWHSTGFQC